MAHSEATSRSMGISRANFLRLNDAALVRVKGQGKNDDSREDSVGWGFLTIMHRAPVVWLHLVSRAR